MPHSVVVSRFETALPLRTREKGGDVSDPPQNRGVAHVLIYPCGKAQKQPPSAALKARRRSYEMARAGPFPLALHCAGSVLAVKGSLRRFALWTAPGRSGRRAAYEGKGGGRAVGCEGELAHDKGYYHSYCGEAERDPFGHISRLEPQPRGAVTRRAVAQRRSRASGLTRPSA